MALEYAGCDSVGMGVLYMRRVVREVKQRIGSVDLALKCESDYCILRSLREVRDCFSGGKPISLAAAFASDRVNAPLIQRARCRVLSSAVQISAGSGNSRRSRADNSKRRLILIQEGLH